MKKMSAIPGRARNNHALRGASLDFGRLSKFSSIESMSWIQIPTYYYDFRRFNLPLSETEATQEFGRNIAVFDNQGTDPGFARQTNAAIGSSVNEPFCALGCGIVAMGEGESFSLQGATVPTPAAETNTPAIHARDPGGATCFCGVVDLSNQPVTTRFATLWWGGPTWRFIEKFFQAYRLQVIVNTRFQFVNESLFDIGMTPVPPEFVGASDSLIPPAPFIRAVNDIMVEKGLGQQFLPPNVVIGQPPGGEADESICFPPALAEVTYGHPRIIGLANRIYCFSRPLVFVPGLRFEVDFVNVEDLSVYQALRNTITLNCSTMGPRFTADIEGLAPQPGPVVENCGIVCTVPGGSVSLGVVFKGFALGAKACIEYLANYLVPETIQAEMYGESGSPYINALLVNNEFDVGLRNRIAGNLGMTPENVVK